VLLDYISLDLYEHLVSGIGEHVVDGLNEICELSVRALVMAAGHKENDMSEATNDQRIKIYTADG